MSLIKKQSLSDQLYKQIRNNIINLTYPMGSKLNVNELQEVYGVSSTPIREAINRLNVEGLVMYENNVGASVVLLKEEDITEIQNLALVLHTTAINFSMKNGNIELIEQQLNKYLQDYYNAITDEEYVLSIFNFMGVFYANSGNKRLDNNMKVIQGEQLMLRYLYLKTAKYNKSKDNYLEKMYRAVLDKNAQKVIDTLTQEYLNAIPILTQSLNSI